MKLLGYTSRQAPGAIPNGTRVLKVNSEPGDGHPDGSTGTVLGSMGPVSAADAAAAGLPVGEYAYFIVWDAHPGIPVGTVGRKVKALKGSG